MIFTSFIIGLPLAIVSLLLAMLPPVSLPAAIDTAFTGVFGLAAPLTHVFPIGTLFTILGIVLSIELGFMIWRFVIFIWKSIPIFGRH